MNERIKQLLEQAGIHFHNGGTLDAGPNGIAKFVLYSDMEKFAELIVAECTAVLFDQSEKLFELCSEETKLSTAQEYELCSNQCVNNIELIEKHFGVEE